MNLDDLGWDERWATALAALPAPEGLTPARVTAVHRGFVELNTDDEKLPVAGAVDDQPVVGDWVGVRDGAVRAILPRRTTLAREDSTLVANADLAIIVSSLNADLNLRRLERFAALARGGGIEPLVALSKGDLHDDPAAATEEVVERLGGLDVLVFSAQDDWGVQAIRARMRPRSTSVLIGMSGVGKSTLVNLLLGSEVQRTLGLRDDDRGQHATTHRELFVLDDGALLIDTPGVRSPALADAEGVEDAFADIAALAEGCRFGDCAHDSEPGCAVRGAVSEERLESMRKLEREGWSAQQRRDRDRSTGRIGREAMRLKGRDD
ncbi:MAG: ribosome small subunit-dependent GTPase A [Solirubrobacteraceae bacterium]